MISGSELAAVAVGIILREVGNIFPFLGSEPFAALFIEVDKSALTVDEMDPSPFGAIGDVEVVVGRLSDDDHIARIFMKREGRGSIIGERRSMELLCCRRISHLVHHVVQRGANGNSVEFIRAGVAASEHDGKAKRRGDEKLIHL
jgi:hypothetical protein